MCASNDDGHGAATSLAIFEAWAAAVLELFVTTDLSRSLSANQDCP